MSFLPDSSSYHDNQFYKGNSNAPESDVFEVITHLMSQVSRIRIQYAKLNSIHAMFVEATPDEGVQHSITMMKWEILQCKSLMYKILTSIPHSEQHDLL